MKDPIKLKTLILDQVDMADVMLSYGVQFVYHPHHMGEAQYRCPFHGKDNKPSARYYGETKSSYCFYCKKRWDVISFIMDKEQLRYYQAMRYIIDRYHLDTTGIPDQPEFQEEKKTTSEFNVRLILLRSLLQDLKYRIELDRYKALCFAYLTLFVKNPEERGIIEQFDKLENKILDVKGQLP